jgi:kumamolisin
MPEETYIPLAGTHRSVMPGAHKVGPADANQQFQVTLIVRPKQKLPDLSQQSEPRQMSREEYLAAYGADRNDLSRVKDFAAKNHLRIVEIDPAQRSVKLNGLAVDFSKAFHVELNQYQYPGGSYRGREGVISLPQSLAGIVEGVFGLDNRPAAQPR